MLGAIFSRFQTRAIALLVASTAIPAAIVGGYNVHQSRQVLTETIGREMQQDGEGNAETLSLFLDTVRADLVYLRGIPSLSDIVRAQSAEGGESGGNGADSKAGLEARSRLNDIYLSFVRARPYYQQIRYLDATGQELVRIDQRDNVPLVVPRSELQNKGDRGYFLESIQLPLDEFYSSAIDLNRENGEIEIPYNPVLRYAISVRDAQGNVRGTLVANLSIDFLFGLIVNESDLTDNSQELIILNQRGYYLYHRDEEKLWGEDLGHGKTIADELPADTVAALLSEDGGLLQDDEQLIFHQVVYPDPETRQHPFAIVYRASQDRIFAPIARATRTAAFVSFVTASGFVLLGVWVFDRLVRQIQGVTGQLGRFSDRVTETISQGERSAYQQAAAVREVTATIERLNATSQQSAKSSSPSSGCARA
ncbi:MAG: cache domain-containing protein [Geitlerinemataceae cyanobacterium]